MSEAGQPTYRLEDLKQRWEKNPSSRLYLQLAEEYRKHERLEEAVAVLKQGLAQRPGDLSAHVALGRYSVELGDTEQAVSALEAAVERDPTHLVASKLLLEVHLQRGDAEKAGERLEIYRLLNDRDPELEHLEYRLHGLREVPAPSEEAAPPSRTPTAAEAELEELISGSRQAEASEPPTAQVEPVLAEPTRVEETPVAAEPEVDLEATQPNLSIVSLTGDSANAEESEEDGSAEASVPATASVSDPFPSLAVEEPKAENITEDKPARGADIFDLGTSTPSLPGFDDFWGQLSGTPPAGAQERGPAPSEVPEDVSAPEDVVVAEEAAIAEDVAVAEEVAVAEDVAVAEEEDVAAPVSDQDAESEVRGDAVAVADGGLESEPAPTAGDVFDLPASDGGESLEGALGDPFAEQPSPESVVEEEQLGHIEDDVFSEPQVEPATVVEPQVQVEESQAVAEVARPAVFAEVLADNAQGVEVEAQEAADEPITVVSETATQAETAVGTDELPGDSATPAMEPPAGEQISTFAQLSTSEVAPSEVEAPIFEEPELSATDTTEEATDVQASLTVDEVEAVAEVVADEDAGAVEEAVAIEEVTAVEEASVSQLGASSGPEAAPEEAAPEESGVPEDVAVVEKVASDAAEEAAVSVEAEETETSQGVAGEEEEVATVTLGSLYLKQGHLEEATKIFEQVLARDPKNHAALAGLSLSKKPEKTGLTAMDLLADRSLSGTIPAGVTAKKVMILSNYLKHLKTARERNHVR